MERPQVSVIVPTYNRKAARALPESDLRELANRQLRAHLAEFLRRAVRHRSALQIARTAMALGRA